MDPCPGSQPLLSGPSPAHPAGTQRFTDGLVPSRPTLPALDLRQGPCSDSRVSKQLALQPHPGQPRPRPQTRPAWRPYSRLGPSPKFRASGRLPTGHASSGSARPPPPLGPQTQLAFVCLF